jgi:hemerythrin
MNMTFAWTPDISVGDEVLDNQHKQLLENLNKLFRAMIDCDTSVVANSLAFLDSYIFEHLSYEEGYMKRYNYPEFESHKKLHENFITKYNAFKERVQAHGPSEELVFEMENFVGNWWLSHIGHEDKKYAQFVASLDLNK